MANRHLSRSVVLQALFEWDFMGKPEDLKAIIDRDTAEFAPGHSDASFIYTLAELVQRKLTIIDDILTKAAPEWPLEKISNVDRSVINDTSPTNQGNAITLVGSNTCDSIDL